jgi:hypothetical protein
VHSYERILCRKIVEYSAEGDRILWRRVAGYVEGEKDGRILRRRIAEYCTEGWQNKVQADGRMLRKMMAEDY